MRLVLSKSDKLNQEIWQMFYFLFIVFELVTFYIPSYTMYRNHLLVCIGVLMLVALSDKMYPFICFFTIYNLCGIISCSVNGNLYIIQLIYPIIYMVPAVLILCKLISFNTAKYVYRCVSIIFLFTIVSAGGVDELIMASSRNTFSIYELQLFSIYMITAYQNNKSIACYDVLIGFFVSILAVGRSGIITFGTMLIVYIGGSYYDNKRTNSPKVIASLVIMSLLIKDYILMAIANFEVRKLNGDRIYIWYDYFSNVSQSLLYILTGAPLNGTYYLDMYSGNLHNSFLELHGHYGIVMVIFIIITLCKRCAHFIAKRNLYLLIPLIGLIIRMNFDHTNFNGPLDVVLIYYILYPYYNKIT